MSNKKVKKYKLCPEKRELLFQLFARMSRDQRLNFILGNILIQNIVFIKYHRTVNFDKINKYLINELLLNDKESEIIFNLEDFAYKYLKDKGIADIHEMKDPCLKQLSDFYLYKEKSITKPFETWQDFTEYVLNKESEEKLFNKIYNFVNCSTKK